MPSISYLRAIITEQVNEMNDKKKYAAFSCLLHAKAEKNTFEDNSICRVFVLNMAEKLQDPVLKVLTLTVVLSLKLYQVLILVQLTKDSAVICVYLNHKRDTSAHAQQVLHSSLMGRRVIMVSVRMVCFL